jgi:hypothetical protein
MTTWGGTTKLTPFAKTDNEPQDHKFRRPTQLAKKQFDRQSPIYDTSRAGMHLSELGKTQSVTITRYNRAIRRDRLPRRHECDPALPGSHWEARIVVAL